MADKICISRIIDEEGDEQIIAASAIVRNSPAEQYIREKTESLEGIVVKKINNKSPIDGEVILYGTDINVTIDSESYSITEELTELTNSKCKVKQIQDSENVQVPILLAPNGHISGDADYACYAPVSQIFVNPSTGDLKANVITGGVWNDYAEYRLGLADAGRCVVETGDGDVVISTDRLQPAASIVTDTYGFGIGETDTCKLPVAVCGRVLAFPLEDRATIKAGDVVCSGPYGTVSVMSREEIINYPDRMVGVVSEIPKYETWGATKIPVNGRIWIKIK